MPTESRRSARRGLTARLTCDAAGPRSQESYLRSRSEARQQLRKKVLDLWEARKYATARVNPREHVGATLAVIT